MFSKILCLVMTFAIFSGSAMASSQDGLKAAFDEFNYSVMVEWDQKDPAFYEAKEQALTESILSLKSAGLTNSELVSFAKSQMKSSALAHELDLVLKAISLNTMSVEEAQEHFETAMKNSMNQGASWQHNNTWGPYLMLGIATAVMASYLILSRPF